jgi:alkaline phosphatase D
MNVEEMKKVMPLLMKSNIVPFIWGRSGVGKTEVIRQIAKSLDMELIYLTFAAVEDVGDIIGLPYEKMVNGEMTTGHMPPDWFPTEGNKLIFIDEFNRAKPQILQAMFPFVLEGRLHTHKLPENCHIVVAGNPPTEDYDVTSMEDNALFSRFCHMNFTPSVEEWVVYMKEQNRNHDVITFFNTNQDLISSVAKDFDIRTVCKNDRRNAEMLAKFIDDNDPHDSVTQLVASGLLGPELGVKFMAHVKSNSERISSEEILNNYSIRTRDKVRRNFTRVDILNKGIEDALTTIKACKEIQESQARNMAAFLTELPNDLAWKGIKAFLELGHDNCLKFIGENEDLVKKFKDRTA